MFLVCWCFFKLPFFLMLHQESLAVTDLNQAEFFPSVKLCNGYVATKISAGYQHWGEQQRGEISILSELFLKISYKFILILTFQYDHLGRHLNSPPWLRLFREFCFLFGSVTEQMITYGLMMRHFQSKFARVIQHRQVLGKKNPKPLWLVMNEYNELNESVHYIMHITQFSLCN